MSAAPNKGMKLTRVGAGAQLSGRSVASSWIAAQLMPGVRRTIGGAMPGRTLMLLGLVVIAAASAAADQASDFRQCKARCEAGDAYQCARLGSLYGLGHGVAADPRLAAKYYKRGCELGEGGACVQYGNVLLKGEVVPRDAAAARSYFERATPLFQRRCDDGFAENCYGLGAAYDEGMGVRRDPFKAVEYFRKACEGDSARGCEHLAWAHYSGEGARLDRVAAKEFYQKACHLGSQAACKVVEQQKW